MIEVYFTRHGETLWNTEERMQGLRNSPLTEKGVIGAQKLGKELPKITPPIGKCLSSPMPRALHTSYEIRKSSGMTYPIEIENLLMEMDLGAWEGVKCEDAHRDYPEMYINFRKHPDKFVPIDGGEDYFDVCARAEKLLKRLHDEYKGQTPDHSILLVSHMILVLAIFIIATDKDVAKLRDRSPIAQTKIFGIRIEDEEDKYTIILE